MIKREAHTLGTMSKRELEMQGRATNEQRKAAKGLGIKLRQETSKLQAARLIFKYKSKWSNL